MKHQNELKKFLKKEFKRYLKEKKRCAAQYPDWRDDSFNVLDNKFIWGFNSMGDEPSFAAWNEAYIYYNRATKKYYLEIDESVARGELGRLFEIKEAFRNFIIDSGVEHFPKIQRFSNFPFEADSLGELFLNFSIQLSGYRDYVGIGE